MRVLLIDADSTIPNLALMKLSTYYKGIEASVDLKKLNIPYYPTQKKYVHHIDTSAYDFIYCSIIFDTSKDFIKGDNIQFGGTGFDLKTELEDKIEHLEPDYSIYPENDTSYGFISRGCIRKCYFCKVPEKEGHIRQVNNIRDIIKHKKVKFLDNNFLALPNHKELLEELIGLKIKCCFNQGLDIRLLDTENSKLLSELNYLGEYLFAFDDYSYLDIINKKLLLLNWRKNWQLKFFLYTNPNMELSNIVKRIEWCKNNKCLPYLMRDISCWESEYNPLYVDLASYCNQPNIFKKMNFEQFLNKRHLSGSKDLRIKTSLELYNQNIN